MSQQDKTSLPDFLAIGDYTFTLQKYKKQDQRQEASRKIQMCFDKFIKEINRKQKLIAKQQITFLYEHLVQYRGQQPQFIIKTFFFILYKFIPNIYFRDVAVINISQSQIFNIEDLAYLRAPTLITFELYGNHITSIKPLVKNNQLPQLRNLTLYRNSIKDIPILQRSKLDSMNYLELDINKTDNVFCEDLTFIYKLPVRKNVQTIRIWYDSAKRVMRPIQNYIQRFNELKR